MEVDVQLPRLTRYLRAFTGLEPRKQHADNAFSKPQDSRNENKPLERTQTFLWSDLWKTIEQHSCMTPGVSKNLKYLQNLAKDICGGQIIVGETAVYLFQLFMQQKKALNKHCSILKLMYTNISYSQVERVCSVVNEIVDELSEDCLASISEKLKKPKGREPVNGSINSAWGDHIRFNFPNPWTPPDTSFLTDLSQGQNTTDSFSMVYNDTGVVFDKKVDNKKVVFGKAWMVKEVEKCCNNSNGLPNDDICNSIINLLTSNRTNDALQNELFDFLGFDNFEFIQSLLEHRKEICMSNKLEQDRKNLAVDKKREPFVTTVTVKSQEEKILEKQARKEEKKLTKFAAKEEPYEPEERFDPLELRAKRIAALTAPLKNDFNSEIKKVAFKKEVYPNVFDSLNIAQQQTGEVMNQSWTKVKRKGRKKMKNS